MDRCKHGLLDGICYLCPGYKQKKMLDRKFWIEYFSTLIFIWFILSMIICLGR